MQFLTCFDKDFYTAFPLTYLLLFRVPTYKCTSVHCLKQGDPVSRMHYSEWFPSSVNDISSIFYKVRFLHALCAEIM